MENLLSNLQTRTLNGWAKATSFLRPLYINGWAPVTSLLRLLFIRAAVPTLTIAVLLALLLKVDQAEEILFDVLGRLVVSPYWGDAYLELGKNTYWAVFFATALLAVVVYLSLLMLAKKESAYETEKKDDGGKSTSAWSPRLLAVANLALLVIVMAVHFSLLLCAEVRGHVPSLFLAPLFFITVSVIIAAFSFQSRMEWLVTGFTIAQIVVIMALASGAYDNTWKLFQFLSWDWGLDFSRWKESYSKNPYNNPLTLPIMASMVMPQLTLLVSWCTRAAQLQRLQYRHVCYGLVFMTLVTSSIFPLLHFSSEFAELMLKTGELATVIVWLACITCWLSGLALLLRVLKLPALFVMITTAITLYWLHEEGVGRETLEMPVTSTVAASNSESGSLPEIPPELRDKMAKVPSLAYTYVISADGGGLRAALYTALVLAFSDDYTCGEFGTRVRAASGVSGGALGIATWIIMREEYIQRQNAIGQLPWQECWNSVKQNLQSKERITSSTLPVLQNLVLYTLLQDHLILPLLGTLFSDFVPFLDTTAIRGELLAKSWQYSAEFTLQQYQPSRVVTKAFATPLSKVTGGIKPTPLIVFSSTDADTGELVTFSNESLESNTDDWKSISVGIAALNSARFPFISPPGLVQIEGKQHRVVDGGFFDNTGATALYSMLRESGNTVPADARYLRINGSIPIDEDLRCTDFFKKAISSTASPDPEAKPASTATPSEQAKFKGWSTFKAIFAVRDAHDQGSLDLVSGDGTKQSREAAARSPLQLDLMPVFNDKCPVMVYPDFSGGPLSEDKAKEYEICQKNAGICTVQNEAKRLPLAWYLSNGSGVSLKWYSYVAALSFNNNWDINYVYDTLFIPKKEY
jgi:hypothetical protein